MAKMFDIREPSFEALKSAPVYFRYGSNKRKILVDQLTANAVLACHDALSEPNQRKFERMVSGTPQQFQRIVDFCWKHVKNRG